MKKLSSVILATAVSVFFLASMKYKLEKKLELTLKKGLQ